ncbi:MAG: hypothetical protein M1816_004730 [Peltula sp. TS41687]|nr:MAG: hypothetical protein M1816_004730 [Peltula sp. TS41687]
MSANTHWTQSRSVAVEGGGPEDTGQQQESMADPPVQPEQEKGRSPTPASDEYDDLELRGDDERALQRALKAIQKKRRIADLHRQIEAERKALDEGVPLPTITGTIRPRSDTSATIAPAPKRSRRNGSDSEDDMSSFVNYIDQLEKDLPPMPEDMKSLRLMCAFRPEIKLAIEQRADIPESREGLITLAINIEGAHKGQRSANPSYAQAASGIRSGGSFKDKGKAKADHKAKEETKPKERQGGYKAVPRVEKPNTTADGRPICFNCNEPGPLSKSCPKPKKERGEGKKVSHLKATPSQKEDKKSVSINAVLHRRREKQEGKPYLSTEVQVRTPTGWKTLTALIDSGANENFISHLRIAELGIKPRLDEATPRVTTIDETQLQVYGIYRPRIRATDNSGTTGESHSRLLAASFTGWDIVLGWPWLKELNPDINWRDER